MSQETDAATRLAGSADAWAAQIRSETEAGLQRVSDQVLLQITSMARSIATGSTPDEMMGVEELQAQAEGFLGSAVELFDGLGAQLSDSWAVRTSEAVAMAARVGTPAALDARSSLLSFSDDIRVYTTYVTQYLAGYVQGGGVAFGLLLELEEGPFDNPARVVSILEHRLLFIVERAEVGCVRWLSDIEEQLPGLLQTLSVQAGGEAASTGPAEAAEETPKERLERLLGMAKDAGVNVKKVPENPSSRWLDKMEAQLNTVLERKAAKRAEQEARAAELKVLLDWAGDLRVRIKKVPEKPSQNWLDKFRGQLEGVAAKKGKPTSPPAPQRDSQSETVTPAPSEQRATPDPAQKRATPDPAQERATPDPADRRETLAPAPERDGQPEDTSDPLATPLPAERTEEVPQEPDVPDDMAQRIEKLIKASEKAKIKLGRVPASPTLEWLEVTEQLLESALSERKKKKKAEREKKKRDRDERIKRLKEDAERLGVDLGRVPPFPTPDWIARAEMRIASVMLRQEDAQEESDFQENRADLLREVLAKAEASGVDLGEVPPDPERVWFAWAEGRLRDAEAADEVFAVGGDPDEVAPARLVYEEGSVQEQAWDLMEELIIGRTRACDVHIRDDGTISRKHARMWVDDEGAFWIEDLKSTKGTEVEGYPISGAKQLMGGESVATGDTEFVFRVT